MADLSEFSLREIIDAILEQAEEQGMRPPFIVIGVSPNGSTSVARFKGDGEAEMLAEHYEEEGFRLPMTLALIDQNNNAIRGEITAEGKHIWH
jgi:hypothetical protein